MSLRELECSDVKCIEVTFPIKTDELLGLMESYPCFRSSTLRILRYRFRFMHHNKSKEEVLSNLKPLTDQGLELEWVQL